MNQREYAALFSDAGISHVERTLYMYLRWHMDYASGLVGQSRRISYQALREHLEYHPARCSNERSYYPSKPQVNRMLRKLEERGLIERVHKGGVREAMVFRLVLASTDLDRSNEARHKRDTRTATQGATQHNPINSTDAGAGRDTERDQGATQEARHTSVTSDKDLSLNAREEFEPGIAGEELQFSDQFLRLARNLGLSAMSHPDQEVKSIFELFRTYGHRAYTEMQMPAWLNDWRSWVNREKVRHEKQQCSYQQPKQPAGGNAVANALRTARNYQSAPQGAGNDDW